MKTQITVPINEYNDLVLFKEKVMSSNFVVAKQYIGGGFIKEDIYFVEKNDLIEKLTNKITELSEEINILEYKLRHPKPTIKRSLFQKIFCNE